MCNVLEQRRAGAALSKKLVIFDSRRGDSNGAGKPLGAANTSEFSRGVLVVQRLPSAEEIASMPLGLIEPQVLHGSQ